MSKCPRNVVARRKQTHFRIKYKMKSKMQISSYCILDFTIIRVVTAILSNPFRQWSNRPIPNRIPIRASVLVNMENVSCSRFAHRRRVRGCPHNSFPKYFCGVRYLSQAKRSALILRHKRFMYCSVVIAIGF